MGYGVFIHRTDSIYDDNPAEKYQFPGQYLGRARACEGNWVIYYEPVKVSGSRGYFAVARVQRIIEDPSAPGMYLALIEPGSYLDFANHVAFSTDGVLTEQGLLNEEGRISGRAQAAVRPISTSDFERILSVGLQDREPLLPREDELRPVEGFGEAPIPLIFEQERYRSEHLTSRIVRDRIFRRIVLRAYDERCVISGLKLINGGGRAEVAAAHIRPVEANGPDIVSNGIALSGTAHWMFDRGIISLTDGLDILVSRQANDTDGVRAFINSSGKALLPLRSSDRPHPVFLRWHRENCFKN